MLSFLLAFSLCLAFLSLFAAFLSLLFPKPSCDFPNRLALCISVLLLLVGLTNNTQRPQEEKQKVGFHALYKLPVCNRLLGSRSTVVGQGVGSAF